MTKALFVALRAVAATAVSTSDISRDFYGSWAVGDRYYWWLCQIMVDPYEVIVEDPEGDLHRMSYTPNDDGTVTFGEPQRVRIEYVDVAAKSETNLSVLAGIAAVRGNKVAARFVSREESRLSATQEGEGMREHIAKLRQKLGLSAETPDEEVLRQAAEDDPEAPQAPEADPATTPAAVPGTEGEPGIPPTPPATPAAPDAPGAPPATPDPERTTGASAAQRAVQVDSAALAQLQADARVGVEERNARLAREDGEYVDAAVRVGKIPPSSRPNLVSEMSRNPESRAATREYLDGLAENVIPVTPRNTSATSTSATEGSTNSDVNQFMAQHMPDVVARKQRLAAGARPRVSGDGSGRVGNRTID